jgi:hypothetical protein
MVTPTTELDNPIVVEEKDELGNTTHRFTNSLTMRLCIEDSGTEVYEITMGLESYDLENNLYTYSCEIETDDYIHLSGRFNVMSKRTEGDDEVIESQPIPMTDCVINLYTDYMYAGTSSYIQTNKFSTETHPVTFIQPVHMVRSTATYRHNGNGTINPSTLLMEGGTYKIMLDSVPLVSAKTMMDTSVSMEFYTSLKNQFNFVSNILDRLLNNYSVDMKFYNTYGRSKNFFVGDNSTDRLDKVNISIHIKVKPVFGVVQEEFIRDLKLYIKDYIENINDNGTNSIYISNLIQSLENNFPDLSYMKFVAINGYPSEVQVIDNKTIDLNTLSKEDRINYVPEYLTISIEDIRIDII